MIYDYEESWDLAIPLLDMDDVQQEAFLLKLMGKKQVSKAIIRKRLSRKLSEALVYSGGLEEGARSAFGGDIVDRESIEQLVRWAQTQSLAVQLIIYHFLEEPETGLATTLKQLAKLGIISGKRKAEQAHGTLSKLLMRSLPATFEDLVELISSQIITERPDATARQFVRVNTRRGKIIFRDNVYRRNE